MIETAQPVFTQSGSEHILSVADYMPPSVSTLADDPLCERMPAATRVASTSLALPHGREMFASQFASIQRAAGARQALAFA